MGMPRNQGENAYIRRSVAPLPGPRSLHNPIRADNPPPPSRVLARRRVPSREYGPHSDRAAKTRYGLRAVTLAFVCPHHLASLTAHAKTLRYSASNFRYSVLTRFIISSSLRRSTLLSSVASRFVSGP